MLSAAAAAAHLWVDLSQLSLQRVQAAFSRYGNRARLVRFTVDMPESATVRRHPALASQPQTQSQPQLQQQFQTQSKSQSKSKQQRHQHQRRSRAASSEIVAMPTSRSRANSVSNNTIDSCKSADLTCPAGQILDEDGTIPRSGWEMFIDEATGTPYYYNWQSGDTAFAVGSAQAQTSVGLMQGEVCSLVRSFVANQDNASICHAIQVECYCDCQSQSHCQSQCQCQCQCQCQY